MEIRPLILAISLIVASVGTEPKPSVPMVFYGTVVEPARTTLMRAWNDSASQIERAYCVTGYEVTRLADRSDPTLTNVIVSVRTVEPAPVEGASVGGIEAVYCNGAPTVHTHPPVTCENRGLDKQAVECYYGGPNAFSCQPSRTDYQSLVDEKAPFGVVQCDRRAFVFYYRIHYTLDKADGL